MTLSGYSPNHPGWDRLINDVCSAPNNSEGKEDQPMTTTLRDRLSLSDDSFSTTFHHHLCEAIPSGDQFRARITCPDGTTITTEEVFILPQSAVREGTTLVMQIEERQQESFDRGVADRWE